MRLGVCAWAHFRVIINIATAIPELGASGTVSESNVRVTPSMSNYCDPLLTALKDCLLHSDCVIKNGFLPSECIKHHIDELPEECRSLRLAVFECKRGMVLPS
jgi:hypothetical protein